jgi:dolichol-phosphate mannosyltransferase
MITAVEPSVNNGSAAAEAEGGAARLSLSVLIPVFNERDTIEQTLDRVRALGDEVEIVVVDDASTDGTREILERRGDIVFVKHEVNHGKGRGIRTALAHATGDVVAIQDADLEYDPQDLPRLMQPIAKGEARVVYGSRFLRGRPRMELPNYICNRLLAWTANLLYGARISDEATCYKVFDRKLLQSIPLTSERFEFCPEVTAKVRKRGEKIVELPISYDPRSYDSGKKIRAWDGVVALWTLVKYRFMK